MDRWHAYRHVTNFRPLHLKGSMKARPEQRNREIELARRIGRGEAEFFDEFAASVGTRLLGYSILLCSQREDAEDVVQETLWLAYQKFPELRDADRVHAWFFRIARNVCLAKRRRECPGTLEEGEAGDPVAPRMLEPEIALLRAELAESIHTAIGSLPENYRTVVLLRCVEELSTEETASALAVSEDVVRAWLHRARQALLKKIGRT